MANTLKIKRGLAASIPQGQLAEPLFTTDTYDLYIGKGSGGNQRIQKYVTSGTSAQFLKGDGSLDSNIYEPSITAGTTLQYWRGDKSWQTLNTGVVPESGPIYFTEPRVLATVLTGLNLTGGGTISAMAGGVSYQGTWNASTNTPTLTSSVGTKGYYYVVSVAGSTNLNGITDWKIGDWAIFNGTTWDKVDNTDAVSSVNGFTGAVNLGLGNISDVTLSSPTNTQLLRFNGTTSRWENWTPTYISGAITSLNGLTASTQTFATGTSGTDFNISSATSTHTFNIPDASATARGVITTGTQTIAGSKTFSSSPTVPSLYLSNMTAGSGALYYNTGANRLTLANYNANGILVFEVNGGAYAMQLNADLTAQLNGYTTNGFVKFTGSNGTLAVDTNTYLTAAITSLNGLTASTQTFATGTSGTDFNISSTTSTHTFNIPSASATARGLITTGTQTIAGDKTLTGALSGTSATFTGSGSLFSGGTDGNLNTYPVAIANNKNLVFGSPSAQQPARMWSGGIGSDTSENIGIFVYNDFRVNTGSSLTNRLIISSTGAATFSSSVTAGNEFISLNGYGIKSYTASTATGNNILFSASVFASFDGIYQSSGSTNDFGIWTNGGTINQPKFVIKNGGNVGIGTTAPSYKFHVQGTSYFFDQAIFGDKIGIGTTSPNQTLDVNGISRINPTAQNAQLQVLSPSTYGSFIYWGEATVADRGILGFAGGSGDLVYRSGAGNFTNGTERMRITSAGNVEVTTTTFAQVKINNAATTGSNRGTSFEVNSTTNAGTNFVGQFNAVSNNANAPYSSTDAIYLMSRTSGIPLIFTTNNSGTEGERMRITSGGDVGINATPGVKLEVRGSGALVRFGATSGAYLEFTDNQLSAKTSAGAASDLYLNVSGANTFLNRDSGEVRISGTTDNGAYNLQCNGTGVWGAGAYVNGSDIALKENIKPILNGLDFISKMNPVSYNYIESYSKDRSLQTGFIAQDLLEVFEGQEWLEGIVKKGNQYYNVAYQNLIPILTKAIQELKSELDILKNKN